MFKVCIISCGMIANEAHIPAYRMFPDDFEIVGVCDINETAAQKTASNNGILHYYTNAEQMLCELKPDVVSVCVPNCFHKEYTIMALNHGANVLCEKPLAFTYEDAVDMYDTAKRNNRFLMACQSMRYTPDRLAAKKYILQNGIDDFYYGEISRIRTRGIPTWGTFHIKKINCGGAFLDIGVHMLDALLWLLGNPKIKSVTGAVMQNHKYEIGSLIDGGVLTGKIGNIRKFDPEEMDVEDFSCGMLTFENGVRVNFKVAWAANMPEESSISIIGKTAGIYIPEGKIFFGDKSEKKLDMPALKYKYAFPGHIYLADNIRKVLKGEEDLAVKPEETINVSKIIELFYDSANQNREEKAEGLK